MSFRRSRSHSRSRSPSRLSAVLARRGLAFACVAGVSACILALVSACASSNGPSELAEVRDAPALESSQPFPRTDAGDDEEDEEDAATEDAAKGDADGGKDSGPPAQVIVNEIFVSDDGDSREWVELRSEPGTSVDDLKLRLIDRTGDVEHEVTVGVAGEVFPASGVWVVGGALANVDRIVLTSGWGLDNERGAIQVVRGTGKTLLDVVGYADEPEAGALPTPPSQPTQTVEGSPALLPASGKSFGRKQANADTNANRTDFCAMTGTPRAVNAACD